MLLIQSHPTITDLPLLIGLSFIQYPHGLEVVFQALKGFEHFLAVGHLLPTDDMLASLEVLVQVIIALLYVEKFVERAG